MWQTLAAIDVGTNSIHLVVARVVGGDHFEVIADEKEMVRLGEGGGDMKRLSPEAIDRAIATLVRFKQIADIDDAHVRTVATSATREAENHGELIQRARAEAGLEIEVISGIEEARLIHLGVLQALPVFEQRLLLCDIGGGSTELLVGQQGEVLASRSLKLGAVRLTNRFFPGARLHPAAAHSCRSFVRSTLQPFAREVEQHGFEVAVGSSGTIQSVAAMVAAARGEAAPLGWNGYRFSRAEATAVTQRLARARGAKERSRVPGLDARRADIALAGAILLESVLEVFDVEAMTVSGYALREGVLLDTIQRLHGGDSLHHLRDVSRRSVWHLAELMDDDPEHSAHVAELALQLFDATAELHGLDQGCREHLEAAALLANVGLFISHSRHHLHTYYVVRNSERLLGFTATEVEVIAQVARYHRKSAPKGSHEAFAALDPRDQRVVTALAGILRVAIGLDRSHERRVRAVSAEASGRRLTVAVEGAPGADVSLELYAARERAGLLGHVLGREVEIVASDRR